MLRVLRVLHRSRGASIVAHVVVHVRAWRHMLWDASSVHIKAAQTTETGLWDRVRGSARATSSRVQGGTLRARPRRAGACVRAERL